MDSDTLGSNGRRGSKNLGELVSGDYLTFDPGHHACVTTSWSWEMDPPKLIIELRARVQNDVQVVSTLWADINEEDYGEDIGLENMQEVPVEMESSFQKELLKWEKMKTKQEICSQREWQGTP
ncbi:hypothetical protein JHK86_006650 [Glycine max]|nr:hypothetical protein JHK86_006650 [Glycine max]